MIRLKKIIAVLFITIALVISILYAGYIYKDEIYVYYRDEIEKEKESITLEKNEYYKDKNYEYVQNTEDFIAKDKNHLKNIFYSIINSGTENFTFYCSDKYKECTNDITNYVQDQDFLSNINNFVHPYNSFEKINTTYDNYGEISVKITKVYTEEDIQKTNEKVNKIIKNKISKTMNDKEKIEAIHNYIINNGKYATDNIRKKYPNKSFNKARDILINKYGLCSSYADAMAIFLHEFGIDNYKIASKSHIWNLVKINNKWLHLDLTWDDPVTSNGTDKLEILFLLIDNKRLNELKVEKHEFSKEIYKEALN